MTELKRVILRIPVSLLEEADELAAMEGKSRSQVFREAMHSYTAMRKRSETIEAMKRGYREMAGINLALAEEGLYADAEHLEVSELLAAERE